MEYIILILCVAVLALYFSVRRGRTTVRAAMFLMYVEEEGYSVDAANRIVCGTGYSDAATYSAGIIRYASEPFAGSQLKMIAAARYKGFRE